MNDKGSARKNKKKKQHKKTENTSTLNRNCNGHNGEEKHKIFTSPQDNVKSQELPQQKQQETQQPLASQQEEGDFASKNTNEDTLPSLLSSNNTVSINDLPKSKNENEVLEKQQQQQQQQQEDDDDDDDSFNDMVLKDGNEDNADEALNQFYKTQETKVEQKNCESGYSFENSQEKITNQSGSILDDDNDVNDNEEQERNEEQDKLDDEENSFSGTKNSFKKYLDSHYHIDDNDSNGDKGHDGNDDDNDDADADGNNDGGDDNDDNEGDGEDTSLIQRESDNQESNSGDLVVDGQKLWKESELDSFVRCRKTIIQWASFYVSKLMNFTLLCIVLYFYVLFWVVPKFFLVRVIPTLFHIYMYCLRRSFEILSAPARAVIEFAYLQLRNASKKFGLKDRAQEYFWKLVSLFHKYCSPYVLEKCKACYGWLISKKEQFSTHVCNMMKTNLAKNIQYYCQKSISLLWVQVALPLFNHIANLCGSLLYPAVQSVSINLKQFFQSVVLQTLYNLYRFLESIYIKHLKPIIDTVVKYGHEYVTSKVKSSFQVIIQNVNTVKNQIMFFSKAK